MTLFNLRPELGFVYTDYALVDLDGVRHDSAFDTSHRTAREVPFEAVGPDLCVCKGDLFDVLVRGYFISTIVGLVRREVLGSSIRFPADHAYAEEWLFYLQVAKVCRAGFVDEPLCLHHYVRGSLARTDQHRNTIRLCGLLKAIVLTFDDLTRVQRREVRENLASACRQLGYSTYRAGRYGAALAYFAESFRHSPKVRTLCHLLEAGVHSLLPRRRDRNVEKCQSQELSGVVR